MDSDETILSSDITDETKEDILSGEGEDDENNLKDDSTENTDTEESDDNNKEDEEQDSSDPFYLSRDKKTQWLKELPENITKSNGKTIKFTPGVIGFAQGAKSPIEAWQMLFPDSAIDEIVKYTNMFISNIRKDYSRERDACDTNQAEIKAVLGLLYLAGVMKAAHQNLADLWTRDGTGIEYFHATISLKRFRFLLYSLNFDHIYDKEKKTNVEKKTDEDKKNNDKLAPIRTFFDNFTFRCTQHFSIGQNVTIGELCESFKGKCAFKKPLKNNLSTYGIKVYALIDTKLFYTSNMEINTGTKSSACKNVMIEKLVGPLFGSSRNVTYCKKFTSLRLAEDLLDNYNINSVGQLKRNKKEIPKQFLKQQPDILLGFYKRYTLISKSTNSTKPLLYLSSITHSTNEEVDNEKEFEDISFYNNTRKSVEELQELYNNYSVSRQTSRWPLTIFFFLLNIAGINSQVILHTNLKSKLNRREFLISLAKSLTTDYLKMRAAADNLPQHLRMRKRQLAGVSEEETTKKQNGGHGRCTFCSWKKNRKTTTVCSKCTKYICREHTISTCVDCAGPNNDCDSD